MSEFILREMRDSVCRLTLNRPEKHNCIELTMLHLLDERLIEAESDRAVKAIVISGAGAQAFSSGADLKAFGALSQAEVPHWIRLGNAVLNRLATLPKPTIAEIQGYAYGGGLEIALACDFRIATPNAKFSSPELQRGWIPGWGGLMRLRRTLGEAGAKRIAFLGEVIDGSEAALIGLVTKVVPAEFLEATLTGMLGQLTAIDASSFAAAKAAFGTNEVSSSEVELQVISTLLARQRA